MHRQFAILFPLPSFLKSLLVVFLLLFVLHASAQLNNEYISDNIKLEAADSNTYGLSILANTYLRNTEYFNKIEVGRTLFGYQLNPSLYIQPHKNIKLQAGVYIRQDYGGGNYYSQVIPTFTLKIQKNQTSFLFGTLEGALAHRLIEPLFDINSGIERRIENGFQMKHESQETYFDLWINWERFIERGSPYKEQFTAGFNYTPTFIKNDNGFRLRIPFQGTAFHRGGQIDTDTGHVVMVFNGTLGIDAEQTFEHSFVQTINANLFSVYYRENTSSGYFPYKNGYGNYANLFVKTKWLGVMLSYWHAANYIAPRGTTIYQSVSIDNPGYTESNRELLFLRFLYEKEIYPQLFLVARLEPFYDLINKQSDYSYSVYVSYRQPFKLGNVRY